jgi:hypothetical protein
MSDPRGRVTGVTDYILTRAVEAWEREDLRGTMRDRLDIVLREVTPLIRADEREQIAQAIEAAESLAADFTWQGRAFTMGYEGARSLAARIARRGGR